MKRLFLFYIFFAISFTIFNCQFSSGKKISTNNIHYKITLFDTSSKQLAKGLIGYVFENKPSIDQLKDADFLEDKQKFQEEKDSSGIYTVIIEGKSPKIAIANSSKKTIDLDMKFYIVFENRNTKTFYRVYDNCFEDLTISVPVADEDREPRKLSCKINLK